MNKQELIKQIKKLFVFGVKDYIERDEVLVLVEQLDEPETGHADEAPRYVKNILARLRELPLHDREVWLKAIMGEFERDFSSAKWREGYEQGKFEGMLERDKVKVPQFVADWYEEHKDNLEYNIWDWMKYNLEPKKRENVIFSQWLGKTVNNPVETLIKMKLYGYEVEKEKRYVVKVKGICGNHETLNCEKHSNEWLFSSSEENRTYKTKFTRKELEEAGFGWVFDCEGIEIEEVE